jgi:hypothetical protein
MASILGYSTTAAFALVVIGHSTNQTAPLILNPHVVTEPLLTQGDAIVPGHLRGTS